MVSQLEELCFPDPYPAYFLKQLAEANPEAFLVAEREETLVGYAVADKWRDHNHLVSIAVHPHHRRIGVGGRYSSSSRTFWGEVFCGWS